MFQLRSLFSRLAAAGRKRDEDKDMDQEREADGQELADYINAEEEMLLEDNIQRAISSAVGED